MAKDKKLQALSGKISDRIRGKNPPDADLKFKGNVDDEIPPSSESVRRARGQGLGDGATRRRSGDK